MNKLDIESVPECVQKGNLSQRDGADQVWIDVYFNAGRYGIGRLDEDEKSDFLLSLRKRFERLFLDYHPEYASFKTYIRGCIKNALRSWIRKSARSKTAYESVLFCSQLEYDRRIEDYLRTEHDHLQASLFSPVQSVLPHSGIKRRIAEKTAVILLLKSCDSIDERIIANISNFTGIKPAELIKKIERVRKLIEHKKTQREKLIKRRDNAFYFHRKYALELQKLPSHSISYQKTLEHYISQTQSWKRQNKLLSHRYLLSPSNGAIAEELKMRERQVCFYISHANSSPELFGIREESNK